MAEELYTFYKSNRIPIEEDEYFKTICLTTLSFIPDNLIEMMKESWDKSDELEYVIKLPSFDVSVSKYRDYLEDFILECIRTKYGIYGWSIIFCCGNITITFSPKKYEYYKMLLSWVQERQQHSQKSSEINIIQND